MENILKNPTFIAVVAGTLSYSYLSWKKKENNKKKKNKKINKNNNDVLYSFIIAIIVWFLMYGYLNYKQNQQNPQNLNPQLPQQGMNNQLPTYRLVKELSESPKSFTLMQNGSGLVMPMGNNPMPEVFIDNF
jgi:hypothetical protein